jgi:hypothetical protein
MRKLAGSNLAVALFGLTLGLVPTGCSDNAGGNESGVMEKTDGGKGIASPDSPRTPEDYYKKHQQRRR